MATNVSNMTMDDCMTLLEALEPGFSVTWEQYVNQFQLSDQQALDSARMAACVALAAANPSACQSS